MAVNWGLGYPQVDVGAQFQQGLDRGRAQHRQNALFDAQRQLAMDPNSQQGFNALAQADPAAAMQYRGQRAQQQQQVTEQQRNNIRTGARIVREHQQRTRLPLDAQGWAQVRAAAQMAGVDLAGVPEEFDPAYVEQLLSAGQALETQQSQEPTTFQRDLAGAGYAPGTPDYRRILNNRYAPQPRIVMGADGRPYMMISEDESGDAPPPASPAPPAPRQSGEAPAFHPAPPGAQSEHGNRPYGNPLAPGGGGNVELPRVRSTADYEALPPGTEYLDPNGNLRRKGN